MTQTQLKHSQTRKCYISKGGIVLSQTIPLDIVFELCLFEINSILPDGKDLKQPV